MLVYANGMLDGEWIEGRQHGRGFIYTEQTGRWAGNSYSGNGNGGSARQGSFSYANGTATSASEGRYAACGGIMKNFDGSILDGPEAGNA